MNFKGRLDRLDIALLVLLVIGLADVIYLALVELGSVPLFCSQGQLINCQAVTFSKYGYILGIPLADIALVWFVVALVTFFFLKKYRNYWYLLGLGGFIYSVVSMYLLGKICEYCVLLDAVLLIVAIITVYKLK